MLQTSHATPCIQTIRYLGISCTVTAFRNQSSTLASHTYSNNEFGCIPPASLIISHFPTREPLTSRTIIAIISLRHSHHGLQHTEKVAVAAVARHPPPRSFALIRALTAFDKRHTTPSEEGQTHPLQLDVVHRITTPLNSTALR